MEIGTRVWLDGRPGRVAGFEVGDEMYIDINLDDGRRTWARSGSARLVLAGGPKIITEWEYPPIPDRRWDWSAVRDGYEPGAPVGYGRTEAEAVEDLLDLEDDGRE